MDFLTDDNGNYQVANGDLVIGESLRQEVLSITRANQGEYKHYPLVGCNLILMKNSQRTAADIERVIKQQITAAGIEFSRVINMIES